MGNLKVKPKNKKVASAPESEYKMSHSGFEHSPAQLAPLSVDWQQIADQLLKEDVRDVHAPYSPPKDAVPPKMDEDGNIIIEINGAEYKMKISKPSWDDIMKTIPTRGVTARRHK